MIPLSSPESLKKFPKRAASICLTFLTINIFLHLFFKDLLLSHLLFTSTDDMSLRTLLSFFIYPTLYHALVSLWFLWILLPTLYKNYGFLKLFVFSSLSCLLSSALCLQFSQNLGSSLLGQLPGFALLGLYIRRGIWGEIESLVFGPGIFKIFQVPSYVLLFFFFFHHFIGSFFMQPEQKISNLYYLAPLLCLAFGFIFSFFDNTNTNEALILD